jgi:hypothetical protein
MNGRFWPFSTVQCMATFNGIDAPTRNGIDVPKWMCHTPLTEEGVTMKITTICVDLEKSVFQIHGVDGNGKPLLKKQIKRSEMATFFSNIPPEKWCQVRQSDIDELFFYKFVGPSPSSTRNLYRKYTACTTVKK